MSRYHVEGPLKIKKLLVYLDEERLEDFRQLAKRNKTTMSNLARYAIEEVFEDQLDVVAGERGLEKIRRDPSSTVPLEVFLKERGIALPAKAAPKSRMR
jgi:hypothetical protein